MRVAREARAAECERLRAAGEDAQQDRVALRIKRERLRTALAALQIEQASSSAERQAWSGRLSSVDRTRAWRWRERLVRLKRALRRRRDRG